MKEKWISDTGLICIAGFLLMGLFGARWAFGVALCFVVVQLLFVRALYPIAWVWFQFVRLLSYIQPKIFFGLVFYLVIVPVGLIRKFFHKAPKAQQESNFIDRTHTYVRSDIEQVF
jgi:hypothetical protein